MYILVLLVVVFAAGFIVLVGLIVLETDLCPHSVRRFLQRRQPLSENEEQAKVDLRKTHSRRLKRLEA